MLDLEEMRKKSSFTKHCVNGIRLGGKKPEVIFSSPC